MNKLIKANKKIEKAVVGGYKVIENGVVGGYKKIEDAFVKTFLTGNDDKKTENKSESSVNSN